MRIRIFSNYTTTEILHKLFQECFDIPSHIQFTSGEDYTHAIIINGAMPVLPVDVPPTHVVGLAYEPWGLLKFNENNKEYIRQKIGKYLCGESYRENPFVGYYPYMPIHSKIECMSEKRHPMSIVFSQKQSLTGHKYRHQLVDEILKRNWPIDIYGKGCNILHKRQFETMNRIYHRHHSMDSRIKDSFKDYEPYAEYLFTIVIENTQSEHYISEKVLIPLLMNTTPLYWGATEIETYFPNMTIPLTGTTPNDLKIIANVLENPLEYKKEIDRMKLRNTINPFEHLSLLFS